MNFRLSVDWRLQSLIARLQLERQELRVVPALVQVAAVDPQLLLGEPLTLQLVLALVGVAAGIVLVSRRKG